MAPTMLVAGVVLVVIGVGVWVGPAGALIVGGLCLIAAAFGIAWVRDRDRRARQVP